MEQPKRFAVHPIIREIATRAVPEYAPLAEATLELAPAAIEAMQGIRDWAKRPKTDTVLIRDTKGKDIYQGEEIMQRVNPYKEIYTGSQDQQLYINCGFLKIHGIDPVFDDLQFPVYQLQDGTCTVCEIMHIWIRWNAWDQPIETPGDGKITQQQRFSLYVARSANSYMFQNEECFFDQEIIRYTRNAADVYSAYYLEQTTLFKYDLSDGKGNGRILTNKTLTARAKFTNMPNDSIIEYQIVFKQRVVNVPFYVQKKMGGS